jgi:Arc/MetJ-type ribon-helix-helix transcriptional regulator
MKYDSAMRTRKQQHIVLQKKTAKRSRNTQTSLRLPEGLYERAKKAVEAGATSSVNELLVKALTAYLRALERRAIDEAFQPMANDRAYQREAEKLAGEFSASDAESLRLSEQDLVGS